MNSLINIHDDEREIETKCFQVFLSFFFLVLFMESVAQADVLLLLLLFFTNK